MRSIWTGTIGFGLVNIPVSLYPGTQDHNLNLDMLHKTDMSPIRYAKVCKADGKELETKDIVKGFEVGDGDYVVITDEDFKKAAAEKSSWIEILQFCDADEIDSVYYDKPYYLEPAKGGDRAYALLCDALRESKKVGIAKFVLRNREHLAILKPSDNLIILNQMRFHEQVREATELRLPEVETSDRELKMAMDLIKSLTQSFDPAGYRDEYVDSLKAVIDSKINGNVIPMKTAKHQPSNVKDLMSLLKASLEEPAKAKKSKTADERKADTATAKKAAARDKEKIQGKSKDNKAKSKRA